MSISDLLPALHGLSLDEKLEVMDFLRQDVEQFLLNRGNLSGDREVLIKTYDGFREGVRFYQQSSKEVRISESRLTTKGHGLSLQELVKLPLTERHRLLSPFVAEMAEDFANHPELTEFAMLDGEDWDELDANF